MYPVTSKDGVTFIIDDWKSSLWTMDSVFDFLRAAQVTRKIVVIGTLSDYGGSAGAIYSRVAKTALDVADHVVFVGPMATHALRAKSVENAERLHVFSTVKGAADFLDQMLLKGDLVVVKGTVNADHLGRIAHHRIEPISCWSMTCRKNMPCSSCDELRASQRNVSRQGDGSQAIAVQVASAALPRLTGPFTVLVGIGNPGDRYRNTPHNVGFEVMDAFAKKHGLDWAVYGDIALAHTKLKGTMLLLVKPQSYVNNTGKTLKKLSDSLGFAAEDCILIQDDIHLPLGTLRSRARGSDGGHKGVRAVLVAFQINEFRRLKVGVAPAEQPNSTVDYLVAPFGTEASAIIDPTIEAAVERLVSMIEISPSGAPGAHRTRGSPMQHAPAEKPGG